MIVSLKPYTAGVLADHILHLRLPGSGYWEQQGKGLFQVPPSPEMQLTATLPNLWNSLCTVWVASRSTQFQQALGLVNLMLHLNGQSYCPPSTSSDQTQQGSSYVLMHAETEIHAPICKELFLSKHAQNLPAGAWLSIITLSLNVEVKKPMNCWWHPFIYSCLPALQLETDFSKPDL